MFEQLALFPESDVPRIQPVPQVRIVRIDAEQQAPQAEMLPADEDAA